MFTTPNLSGQRHTSRFITWGLGLVMAGMLCLASPSLLFAQDDEAAEATDGEEAPEGGAEPSAEEGAQPANSGGGSLQRGNRMEFDARLIRGETAGSGAVFLFQRAPRALPSMVALRTSYLTLTLDEVLGEQEKDGETTRAKVASKDGGSKSKAKAAQGGTKAKAKKKVPKKKRSKRRRRRRKRR